MGDDWYKILKKGFDYVLSHDEIKLVLMTHCINGSEKDLTENLNYYQAIYRNAENTFALLTRKNKKIIYLIDCPQTPYFPRSNIRRKLFDKNLTKFDKNFYWGLQTIKEYNRAVKKAAEKFSNVKVVDLSYLFCDDNFCYSTRNRSSFGENIYQEDGNHLNYKGSKYVAEELIKEIENVLKDK